MVQTVTLFIFLMTISELLLRDGNFYLSRTDEDRKVRGSLDGILISLLGQIINRKKSSRKAKYHWTQQTKFRARREINANSIEKLRNLKMEADAADPATGAMVEIDDESFF